jgi:HAD superfamily hydrolase (TIGR01458 family)
MSAILFDLDGVLYESDTVISGAADTVNWFLRNHIPHLFLTNTTSKSRTDLVDKLARFGIETTEDKFLTPPVAACQLLRSRELNNIALFVPRSTRDEFSAFDILTTTDITENPEAVSAVIIGDLGTQWTFEILNSIFRVLIKNSETILIALGMTRYWKTDNGLQLDVGPMVKALEYATDRHALITGKPSPDFFQAATGLLSEHDDVVMIGDDIRGDIEASQQAGMKAIQVRTGKFKEADLSLGIKPDAIMDSIKDLPEWWQKNMP